MPAADVSVWSPKVEHRDHPYGEAGVVSSLEEVCKRAKQGSVSPKVRMWAIECLDRARQERGLKMDTEKQRAEVLLKAVQKKLWVPDPVGTEWMAGAHLMACDPKKDGVCFRGEDCDGLVVLLAACFLGVGLYTCIVGHAYNRHKQIQHVITTVFVGGRWHYADPSTDLALGECVDFKRERVYSVPNIQMLCDRDVCFTSPRVFNPEQNNFVAKGDFVGVNGVPDFAWIVDTARTHDGQLLGVLGDVSDLVPADIQESLRQNPVTELMLEKDFCISNSCLREYVVTAGRVGGAAVGGAVCATTGPVALVCSSIGMWVGGMLAEGLIRIGKKLGRASGQTLEEQEFDAFVDYLDSDGPESAAETLMAIVAYGAERKAAVEKIKQRVTGQVDVSVLFSRAGAPTLEQASDMLHWTFPPDRVDTTGFPRGLFNHLENPGKNHPLWAEWKIASQIYPHGVSTDKLTKVYAMLHPPAGARNPNTITYVRQWQEALRTSFSRVWDDAAKIGHIDTTQDDEKWIPRVREGGSRRNETSSTSVGWVVAGALGLGVAWWFLS